MIVINKGIRPNTFKQLTSTRIPNGCFKLFVYLLGLKDDEEFIAKDAAEDMNVSQQTLSLWKNYLIKAKILSHQKIGNRKVLIINNFGE